MGIIPRKQDDSYVISSDLVPHTVSSKRASRRVSDVFQVWTGTVWSEEPADGMRFETLDAADEYVRAHYTRLMAKVE